jgi:hypothetical protein
MYSFSELCPNSDFEWNNSFAYWLCRLHREPKPSEFTAERLKRAMSHHFDVEEQAYEPKQLNSPPDLIPKVLTPIAPVTLALRWSPFPMTHSVLGEPVVHARDREAVFAVWNPRYLGADSLQATSADESHFVFLLKLAASAAIAGKSKILLVGSPGWSYSPAVGHFMNPGTALMMHDAGYLFTERVPR